MKSLTIFYFLIFLLLSCAPQGFGVPVLVAPIDGSTIVQNPPTFIWQSVAGANAYDLEIAKDIQFTDLVIYMTCYADTTYTPPNSLAPGTFFWRVCAMEGG